MTRICTRCKKEKSIDAFSKNSKGKDGIREKCKECCSILYKEYCQRNPVKNQERHRKYRESHPNAWQNWAENNWEHVQDYNSQYYQNHKEHMRAIQKEWRLVNKGIRRSIEAKRRASKLQATPPWVDLKEIETIYVEANRLTQETGIQHHVDHIVPLRGKNVCGLHVPWNLQILTETENCKKHNKLLI